MISMLRQSLLLGAFVYGGCFVVDPEALNGLKDDLEPDAGGLFHMSETCDEAKDDIRLIPLMHNTPVTVSTTGLANNLNPSLCPGITAPGADGFLKIEGQSGQFWHFHISAQTAGVDPVVAIYPVGSDGVCNVANCTNIQDLCNDGEEHFGLRLSQSGTWVLAIDTKTATAGEFSVTAFSPVCGDGSGTVHGENCDDGNNVDDDACDNSCRNVFKTDFMESGINNDQFWADRVIPTPGDTNGILISGGIDPCDADLFAVQLPAGRRLVVTTQTAGGAGGLAYSMASQDIRLTIENASFSTSVAMVAEAGTGFGVVSIPTSASGGLYFVRVRPVANSTAGKAYALRVAVL